MIDSYLRSPYQNLLVNPLVNTIQQRNVHPHLITLMALLFGIAIIPALSWGHPILSLLFLLGSGYCDTLDGSIARAQGQATPQGAVLDIVADRAVEFSIVLGLYLVDPYTRGISCLLLLGSILLCVTSFLVVGIFIENDSHKSFHYSPGLMERSEAFLLFALMILFPSLFLPLALLFSILVMLTAAIRVKQFYCVF